MRFFVIATVIAVATAVVSAALPVEPMNAFVLQQEDNEQHVLQDKKPFDMTGGKSYIVAFKDTAAAEVILKAEKEILAFGGKIGHRYTTALRGFSAWIPGPIVTAMSTNPFIDYIEEDGEVNAYLV
ncbi:hypothetical protein CPB97_010273 [Podila verticillata]|nr:hypothetical protein CPB97_010273 [Podila verticillata]